MASENPSSAYQLDIFGGMDAGKRSRELLLGDLRKGATQGWGMSTGEKAQATGAANEQAAANLQGQARQQGQMALASGPLSSVAGRAQAGMAGNAAALANTGALASLQTERTSQAIGEQRRESARAALEREEDRARQDAQFWTRLLLSPVLGSGEKVAGGVGAAIGSNVGELIAGAV